MRDAPFVVGWIFTAAVSFANVGCSSTPSGARASGAPTAARNDVAPRLYDGFGNYHRRISTSSAAAQQWFDQGMQLLYGFNHDEAIRSFRQAATLDPNLAIAWWGIAYANGLHINNPQMSEQQSKKAWEATQEAQKRIHDASDVEKALIRAVTTRYGWPIPEDRAHLDQAYADAMEQVWKQYPNDPDVGALFAESLMNLQPWDLWTRSGSPKGRTLEIVATLERVLELKHDHPGANHFYVHAMEASLEPERALPSADRLTRLVPGSGHLVHMPAHIYARLGRWADASDSNVQAIAVDRAYFRLAPPPDFYSLYFVHNIHFLTWSAMMEGRYETAMRSARELERDIPQDFLRDWPQFADGFMPTPLHVMIRFGKWKEILAEPEPAEFRKISRAMRHYARGIAYGALGNVAEAQQEAEAFERAASLIPDDWQVGQNKAHDVIKVARHMLRGELAYREGRRDEAFASLQQAIEDEESLVYDEPPGWMQPVRHALGALLMGDRRYEQAERVYRDDLQVNRDNGWSILGLRESLMAQGRQEEALTMDGRLRSTWRRADVRPQSSCYCEPKAR